MIPIEPIPETLEEAVDRIYSHLSDEDRPYFKDESSFGWMHHGLGQHLRNEWGLWRGSPLKDYFMTTYGLGHADDMSGIILDSVRSKVLNKSFDIEKEVRRYKEYWGRQGVDPLTQKQIPGWTSPDASAVTFPFSSGISQKLGVSSWITKVGSTLARLLKR
jgi:hypothetical protein